jgi:predicted amidophosphoribosyltransferase
MAATKPTRLTGPWDEGFALDVHTTESLYIGDDSYGHPLYQTTRSEIGELIFRLKYRGEEASIAPLCDAACALVKSRAWSVDMIVGVPPSRPGRRIQPVPLLADAVGKALGVEVCKDCVKKVKSTAELKTIYEYQKRLELLAGAYSVAVDKTKGRNVLLIDDLYRSGATLEAVSKSLKEAGQAGRLFALAFTRTRKRR